MGKLGNGVSTFETLLTLDFADNQLSGTIPRMWERLNTVQFFDLSNNSFVDGINGKAVIPKMTALTHLDLSSNSINETIWEELVFLTELELLDLSSNNFTGTIPPNLGGGSTEIYVQDNPRLEGPLPTGICDNVEILSLDGEALSDCDCCVCQP